MLVEGILAALLANGCPQPAAGEPEPVSANPDWLLKPTYTDIYWAYPSRAVAEQVKGSATIQCEVSEQGAAEACSVISETPSGYGFGEAAISLTSKMLFKPRLECGKVMRGSIRIPIAFKLPEQTTGYSTAALDPENKKLGLAARLVAAMNVAEGMKEASDMGAIELIQSIDEERAANEERPLTAEEREALHDIAREVWAENEAKILNSITRYYASKMSEEELSGSVAFFEGPAGKKLSEALQGMGEPFGKTLEDLYPDLILNFRRRVCQRSVSLCDEEGEV